MIDDPPSPQRQENVGGIALIRYSRAKFTAYSTTSNHDVTLCSSYADTVE